MSTGGVSGNIKHLRISDSGVGQAFGPAGDTLATEVVVVLEGSDRFFGFEIKPGPNMPPRLAMLSAIREAFFNDCKVGFKYEFQAGKKASTILWVDLER
jgi:hypothetical protein